MEKEIALPYPVVLEAVDVIEAQDVLLLGWEALASYADGGFGGYPGEVFTGLSLGGPASDRDWSEAVRQAAAAVRETIAEEATTRVATPPVEGVELIFCLTCARRGDDPGN